MGKVTPELARKEAEQDGYADWVRNGRPTYMPGDPNKTFTTYMGVLLPRLQEMDAQRQAAKSEFAPASLIAERGKTHGDWKWQASLSQRLKSTLHDQDGWERLAPFQREALEMIAVKMSRIVSGDASTFDHWDDIAGYALLGKQGNSTT